MCVSKQESVQQGECVSEWDEWLTVNVFLLDVWECVRGG